MNDAVAVRNLSHRFSDHPVLKNLNFQVANGEIFGLLGPSGAGKTTLIKILTGQLRQSEGYAEILGKDTQRLGEAEHRQIGTMMDHFGLYERLSVQDNLAFYAELYRVPRRAVDDVLKSIGLYEARRRPVSKLSKGMKNRLSLARALMNNARLLFLDEPTAGLDPVTTRKMHRILLEQRDKGATIFLTTHNLFEAESLCDHVALLSQGTIIEYGKPADICKKYNHLNKLRVILKDGEALTLENGSASAEIIKAYLEENRIETIHSTEPTLESVFVELTGKGLDEYAPNESDF